MLDRLLAKLGALRDQCPFLMTSRPKSSQPRVCRRHADGRRGHTGHTRKMGNSNAPREEKSKDLKDLTALGFWIKTQNAIDTILLGLAPLRY